MARRRRLRTLLLAGVAVLAAGTGATLQATDLLQDAELESLDARFAVRGTQPAPSEVVVVAIDDRTFDELDEQWPFPRRFHAKVIDELRAAGARRIGVDIQFTEQTTEADDNALILAVERAKGTVLATTEVGEDGESNVLGGDELLAEIGAKAGNAAIELDADGVFRRVPRSKEGLAGFAHLLAGSPPVRQDPSLIDYAGPPRTVRTVSYSTVHAGRADPALFRDRIVVIGPDAISLQDVHPTSVANDQLMGGAEIQANAVSTYLRGVPLRTVPVVLELVIAVALGLIAPLAALSRWRPWLRRCVPLLAGLAFLPLAQLLFSEAGLVVPVVVPLLALAVGFVGALAVDLVTNAFERERLYDLFSRFVPDAVVAEVVSQADDGVRLGGVARTSTVMFCDLRGFTTFAETRPPEAVIGIVNVFLGEMSDAILDAGGTLVAYMGDGIFAVFGAPLEQDDHADRALAAAREMLEVRLPRFNQHLADEGLEAGFRMGIGLNTGRVISGNVGSERRLEYAAIGDTTNTAARLEAMTKESEFQLLLSDATRQALLDEPGDLVPAGDVELRGRQGTIDVFSLRGAR